MVYITLEFCKQCAYYNPIHQTCKAVGGDLAKNVRLDKDRCGPTAKFFTKKTIVKIMEEIKNDEI
jgi:hypothetical protein